MKNFELIKSGIDVGPLRQQLSEHPELWDAHEGRTTPESPHYGVSDIWVRYRAKSELTSSERFREPHFAEFYPAWDLLPAMRPIVFSLMTRLEAVYLGGVLITKIPAGGHVKPHHDRGSWHAEYMNAKVYVGVQSNPQCVNYCDGDQAVINAGDAVIFNNLLTHSVENNGDTDRITLICCYRVEGNR